ncbi:MAG: helix-turn-helix transcriptional regulator [Firmicutes bacterium]|uniref:Transcriptional regulator n=1 Tax=Kroppenstedtia guangzhouensis TaxID=1274356 RepID=A0ABQ1GN85_9BACL|nr:helix-turn-helix transcriptional regulator [Kroppenstedtia guangzhouensis]EGK10197.1 XRE family transcriptional regulator [Desmospora sp. 8437]MDA8353627.1 helix-turn-helix transcriptional regulator [Bacillota bacterium]GGA46866.1 transcriptional regulator [Kroppenstedtia guangzhouensis]
MSFGQRLKELRKKRKITQAELAKVLGVDNTTISKWESNTYEPEMTAIKEIADFFNVSADYLLGRTNVPSQFETEAAHRTDDPMDDLPQQAREDIEKFKEFIRQKYGIE